MMLKIDLKKAYDRVKWNFLDKTLECLGFFHWVRSFISNCVGFVQYRLLLNGNIGEPFKPIRGLR